MDLRATSCFIHLCLYFTTQPLVGWPSVESNVTTAIPSTAPPTTTEPTTTEEVTTLVTTTEIDDHTITPVVGGQNSGEILTTTV